MTPVYTYFCQVVDKLEGDRLLAGLPFIGGLYYFVRQMRVLLIKVGYGPQVITVCTVTILKRKRTSSRTG